MSESAEQKDQERDLALLAVKGTTKAAAAVGGMSGAIAVLTGLQFTTSASFYEALYNVVPWALSGLGALQLALSLMVLRNHFPATLAASVLGVIVALVALVWAVLSSSHGFVTAFALLEVPLAGSAAILAPLALGPTHRAWQAKKRLSDAGLELGL